MPDVEPLSEREADLLAWVADNPDRVGDVAAAILEENEVERGEG